MTAQTTDTTTIDETYRWDAEHLNAIRARMAEHQPGRIRIRGRWWGTLHVEITDRHNTTLNGPAALVGLRALA